MMVTVRTIGTINHKSALHDTISGCVKACVIIVLACLLLLFKDKVEYWSCNCILKETVRNRSEKVDHVAYKYWCVLQLLQGSGVIKMIRNLAVLVK